MQQNATSGRTVAWLNLFYITSSLHSTYFTQHVHNMSSQYADTLILLADRQCGVPCCVTFCLIHICWGKGSSRECVLNVRNASHCFSKYFYLWVAFRVTQQGVHSWVKRYVQLESRRKVIERKVDKTFLFALSSKMFQTSHCLTTSL